MLDVEHRPEMQHDIIRIPGVKKPRYRCNLCLREGDWDTRSLFLKHSCAGIPETRRTGGADTPSSRSAPARLQQCTTRADVVASLGERSQSFANAFRIAVAKSCADPNNLLKPALLACRSLACFSLPPSAGLARRPPPLEQSLVSSELQAASVLCNQGSMPSSDAWHGFWHPTYDKEFVSEPLWRPREPD